MSKIWPFKTTAGKGLSDINKEAHKGRGAHFGPHNVQSDIFSDNFKGEREQVTGYFQAVKGL